MSRPLEFSGAPAEDIDIGIVELWSHARLFSRKQQILLNIYYEAKTLSLSGLSILYNQHLVRGRYCLGQDSKNWEDATNMTELLRFKMSNVHLKQGCKVVEKNNDWNILSKTNKDHFSCYLQFSLPGFFGHRRNAQGFGEPEASWKGTRMLSLGWWHDKTHHPPVLQSSPQRKNGQCRSGNTYKLM